MREAKFAERDSICFFNWATSASIWSRISVSFPALVSVDFTWAAYSLFNSSNWDEALSNCSEYWEDDDIAVEAGSSAFAEDSKFLILEGLVDLYVYHMKMRV